MVGETPLLKKLVNEARAHVVTPAQQEFIDVAASILLDPENPEWAFMARHLMQRTLPHKSPGKVERWLRRNGNLARVVLVEPEAAGARHVMGKLD